MITSIFSHISNFFFPRNCLLCFRVLSQDILKCYDCIGRSKLLPSIKQVVTDRLSINVISAFYYEKPLDKVVKSKFLQDRALFKTAINTVYLMRDKIFPTNFFENAVLVPIPIHWSRRLVRGFNQTDLLCSDLSRLFKVTVCSCCLFRQKNTKFQAILDARERWLNVKDAFLVNSLHHNCFKNKSVILVDDLFTSGATLKAAAKEVLKTSSCDIKVFTLFRAKNY